VSRKHQGARHMNESHLKRGTAACFSLRTNCHRYKRFGFSSHFAANAANCNLLFLASHGGERRRAFLNMGSGGG